MKKDGYIIAKFTVFGEPQGKARPRFSRRGGGVTTYTPKKTVDYEREVVRAYKRECGGLYFGAKIPLIVYITAFFKPPKSASKEALQQMFAGDSPPTKKPDVDNIIKAVCDALNGVAYVDDAQVVFCSCKKRWAATEPRVAVTITATARR